MASGLGEPDAETQNGSVNPTRSDSQPSGAEASVTASILAANAGVTEQVQPSDPPLRTSGEEVRLLGEVFRDGGAGAGTEDQYGWAAGLEDLDLSFQPDFLHGLNHLKDTAAKQPFYTPSSDTLPRGPESNLSAASSSTGTTKSNPYPWISNYDSHARIPPFNDWVLPDDDLSDTAVAHTDATAASDSNGGNGGSTPPTTVSSFGDSPKGVSNNNVSAEESMRRLLQLDDTPETFQLLTMAIARGLPMKDILVAGLRSLNLSNTTAPVAHPAPLRSPRPRQLPLQFSLPDPVKNNLVTLQQSQMDAYVANALQIGLNASSMLYAETQSPFYRPQAQFTKNPAYVSGVIAEYAHIPPDLRPTPAQVIHKHHPWLDLFPFPAFRSRGLQLSLTDPPAFDRWELKKDILKGGIVCWRSKDSDGVNSNGTGQPWDSRSWEAQPWFLTKWWWLLGGKEGELWRQSRWWRGMRGETEELDLGSERVPYR